MEQRYQRVQQLLAFRSKHSRGASPGRTPEVLRGAEAVLATLRRAPKLQPDPADAAPSLPADYQSPSVVLRRFRSAMLNMAAHRPDDADAVRLKLYTLDSRGPSDAEDGNHQR